MELKNYQKTVMNDLSSYISAVDETNDLIKGWSRYWEKKDISVGTESGIPHYQNRIKDTPHVCMKVPTGGGKTFMACCSVKNICDHLPQGKPKVVVWLVPSDSILTQTTKTLSDTEHPYRQRLDRDFAGRVGVYTKDMLLNGQNFSPDTVQDMLTVCVMSYASLRINSRKKDVRKVYQENGNLARFADYFDDRSVLLAETPETALIQVLRSLSPIVIVDESHNAGSELSTEMLENLNPSFILELTATPRDSSNIISYVDARELKKENMVKLPVVVFNRTSRQTVIRDAIQLRGNLEKIAKDEEAAGGKYIRPIVLFQAQPRINEESGTFDKIKNLLIKIGIPEEQIAVKTADVDDIGDTNLLSSNCPIRYIITVNALKEGWDCPFAYILASLANKSSKVDVEQILGRILRQPYTMRSASSLLNTSYVLTSSVDFQNTLDSVVKALNDAGFSRKDYRLAEEVLVSESESEPAQSVTPTGNVNETVAGAGEDADLFSFGLQNPQEQDDNEPDDFGDVQPKTVNVSAALQVSDDPALTAMVAEAEKQSENYTKETEKVADIPFIGGELGEKMKQYRVQEQYRDEIKGLKIPRFVVEGAGDLFSPGYDLLEPENLSEGFSLDGQDAQVSFELSTGEAVEVDIQEQGEAVPKYKRFSKTYMERMQKYFDSLSNEGKRRQCIEQITEQINKKNNLYTVEDIKAYVTRALKNLQDDEMELVENSYQIYAHKIQKKIESLETSYREKQFDKWLDTGRILCQENYVLPELITPNEAIDSIPYSLYEAELNDMNAFEREVIDSIVGTENVRWWHRIKDRKGFRLNGWFNHYPDFMVMTQSGKLLLVEAKGDYLDGDDSRAKLKLGRKWQSLAGINYRYFMVFRNKELGEDGAYTLDRFVEVMKEI